MEEFWTTEINKCLDFIAPWKTRRQKQKKYCLSKKVQEATKKQKELLRKHQINVHNNQIDFQLQRELKRHSNYCNKIIKKEVREKNGTNITNVKNVKEIWNLATSFCQNHLKFHAWDNY